jgi:hypothetical protein
MKRYFALLPLFLGLAVCLPAQQATIQEEKQVIKTYPFSDPEPVAVDPIRRGAGQEIYPYFSFEDESLTGVDQTWNGKPVHPGVHPPRGGREADRSH